MTINLALQASMSSSAPALLTGCPYPTRATSLLVSGRDGNKANREPYVFVTVTESVARHSRDACLHKQRQSVFSCLQFAPIIYSHVVIQSYHIEYMMLTVDHFQV